jgi:hypothetical protein
MAPAAGRDSTCTVCRNAQLAANRDGTGVWILSAARYELEEWGLDGRWVRTLSIRSSPWYVPAPPPEARRDGARGSTSVYALRESGDGLIWVIAQIPPQGEPPQSVRDWTRSNVTVIEVIDPLRRRVIASQTYKGAFMEFVAGTDLIYSHEYNSDDVLVPRVVRPLLVRP